MHIRDEAHRFGITFHRQKRSLAFIKSELEQIPSLGSRSVEKLLQRFRTVSRIRKASLEELTEVIGAHRAEEVVRYFAENNAMSTDPQSAPQSAPQSDPQTHQTDPQVDSKTDSSASAD